MQNIKHILLIFCFDVGYWFQHIPSHCYVTAVFSSPRSSSPNVKKALMRFSSSQIVKCQLDFRLGRGVGVVGGEVVGRN